jgi:hypothetical protein
MPKFVKNNNIASRDFFMNFINKMNVDVGSKMNYFLATGNIRSKTRLGL